MMDRFALALVSALALSAVLQRPEPFPQPKPPQTTPQPPETKSGRPTQGSPDAPTEATLGLPIYPGSVFLTSYDAGRGQRFYLFGTTGSFAELVAYYKTILKKGGELVFEAPATHMFDVGRFNEDTMAFPPGVTIKDYTWGGSAGYPNPHRGAQPARFRTVIQIVPALAPVRGIR